MRTQEVNQFVPLRGSSRELLPNSRAAGPVDPNEVATIVVRTRSRGDVAELEQTVKEMYSKPLGERTYMSHEENSDRYGATKEDQDDLEHYAQEHGLVVSGRDEGMRTMSLTGRLGDLLNAFHANLHMYHHAVGGYRGRQGEILIPKRFEGVVTGIFGFDTRPKHRAPHRSKLADSRAGGPGGGNGVSPTEFARRYNFPQQHGGVNLDGSGQTIAIIELGGGFSNSDLQIFFNEIGVPKPKVSAISVDTAKNHPTKTGDADGEVMLDIEVAGAVAPKANIAVYFAPNQGSGFFDAINTAVHDKHRKPSVISISWGGPEAPETKQSIDAFHELFTTAAALGITVCAASGDHGTADLRASDWDGVIHVDHPACDDMVLGCGGTQIDNGVDVVWNDDTAFSNLPGGGGWATGGGISELFAVPSYQQGINLPKSLRTGKLGRAVPDIAMSATNYFVRVQGGEGASGGTSAVAPLMSALVLLLNQAKGKNVGFMNPLLYSRGANGAVKPVKQGNNGIRGATKGYPAGMGSTGLGTPDGAGILAAL
jgi:kumamolisin